MRPTILRLMLLALFTSTLASPARADLESRFRKEVRQIRDSFQREFVVRTGDQPEDHEELLVAADVELDEAIEAAWAERLAQAEEMGRFRRWRFLRRFSDDFMAGPGAEILDRTVQRAQAGPAPAAEAEVEDEGLPGEEGEAPGLADAADEEDAPASEPATPVETADGEGAFVLAADPDDLPLGGTYIVQAGDSLSSIALRWRRQLGVDVPLYGEGGMIQALINANHQYVDESLVIYEGQRLYIPNQLGYDLAQLFSGWSPEWTTEAHEPGAGQPDADAGFLGMGSDEGATLTADSPPTYTEEIVVTAPAPEGDDLPVFNDEVTVTASAPEGDDLPVFNDEITVTAEDPAHGDADEAPIFFDPFDPNPYFGAGAFGPQFP